MNSRYLTASIGGAIIATAFIQYLLHLSPNDSAKVIIVIFLVGYFGMVWGAK